MRILYVYHDDARCINVQSGRPYSIIRKFEERGHEVIDLFPLRREIDFRYARNKLMALLSGRKYGGERGISYLMAMKLVIEEVISRLDPDCVFSPSSIPLSLVSAGRCRIFTADATFDLLASTYPRLCKISNKYSDEARFQESLAIQSADFCVYPSEWAARSAINVYGASEAKVRIIPFGANIDNPPTTEYISNRIGMRSCDHISFVFVGIDWERKGGELAVKLIMQLNANNIAAHLHVIGVSGLNSEFVTFHGFLDKGKSDQRAQFNTIMSSSHFFLLPTSAEAFGLSFCEALCYGLPCIAYRVGGIGDIIKDGHNGFFMEEQGGRQVIERMKYLIANWDDYMALCINARRDYETKFNWDSFVAGIEDLIALKSL